MSGGQNRLLAAAVAASALLVALVTPSVASASCNGRPSAENVYKECLQTGGGKSGGSNTGSPSNSTPPAHISPRTAAALKHAGKDKQALSSLVRNYGMRRVLAGGGASTTAAEPTALGSAMDLGSGPTALLIVLAGTAALLLGGSLWRSRHRQ